MASWKEIERFKKNVAASRELARRLIQFHGDVLTEWEEPFLISIGQFRDPELSTRQAEKLLEIRDANESLSEVAGFSVRVLLRQCHQARLDLSEENEAWIVSVADRDSVRRRDAYRLLRCARQLGFIDAEVNDE